MSHRVASLALNRRLNVLYSTELFTGWLVAAVVLLLCLMFIDDPGLEHWMNFKNPPHAEYHAYVLLLGLAGGVLCYCWEVRFILIND